MKKLLTILTLSLLASCAQIDQEELQNCMAEQASAMVASGAVTASPMRTSVKKILNVCGVQNPSPELKQQAQAILTAKMK